MSQSRNVYHTSIKLSYKMNLLDDDIVKLIPKSTLHRFRNSDYSNVFGIELSQYLQQNELLIRELLQCRTALNISRCIIKIKNTIIRIRDSALTGFRMMDEIISTVNSVKEITGLDTALSSFRISRSTFHSWSFQVKHYCFDSFIGKCIRRWPNQLSLSSIEKIKSLCEDERFRGWPLVSIAHYARRNNILNISLHTWYKYANLIGISRKPPKCSKKQKTGIRASLPHQFWHVQHLFNKTSFNPA